MALDVAIYFDGGRMHFLHHLTLLSAVRRGHRVTLFSRGAAQNVPACVDIEDVHEILDCDRLNLLPDARLRSTVFQYEALTILKDTITLSFDHFLSGEVALTAEDGHLFGWQNGGLVGTGVLALPQNSAALARLVEQVRKAPSDDAHLGGWGSELLTRALRESGDIDFASPKPAFYALDPDQVGLLLARQKEIKQALQSEASALPIYHECLLPLMRDDFHGLPRYWSALGSAIRENGLSVRSAPACDLVSVPDHVWNNEPDPPECVDWPISERPRVRASATSGASQPAQLAEARPQAVSPTPNTDPLRVMIVTTMRNEAPFILEWVAYHRSIGITDFVVYTNDCDDGTVELLDALAERDLITARIDNPFRSSNAGDWQRAALWDLQEGGLAKDMDWLIPMDVDEFINIHTGDGRFADLVAAMPDADMISMVWRLFGNNFIDTYEDRFVTEQFDRATRENCSRPALAWGFKTAFKPTVVNGLWSVHRPKKIEDEKDRLRWYLGTGRRVNEKLFRTGWRAKRNSAGYDLVSLNHYSLRSSESYLVKKQRGRVNHTKEEQDIGYFFRMNHNVERELSIQPKLPAAKQLFEAFLHDDELNSLHQAAVAKHRARISELKDSDGYNDLYRKITSKLLNVYSRLTPHFGNWIFAVGPKAIPQAYEDWARALFDGRLDPKAASEPPGLQPSGTILPRPEFLAEVNEHRKAHQPEALALDHSIFGDTQANISCNEAALLRASADE